MKADRIEREKQRKIEDKETAKKKQKLLEQVAKEVDGDEVV
jgi:hypothetical protein